MTLVRDRIVYKDGKTIPWESLIIQHNLVELDVRIRHERLRKQMTFKNLKEVKSKQFFLKKSRIRK